MNNGNRLCVVGLLLLAMPSILSAQRNCKKGIPCGGTCISAAKTCHIGAAKTASTDVRGSGANIEGDVFLVMQSGDVKPGAGETVFLLRNANELSTRLAAVCAGAAATLTHDDLWLGSLKDSLELHAYGGTGAPSAYDLIKREVVLDTEVARTQRALVRDREQLLGRSVVAQASTGMRAHYRFSAVAPGDYAVNGTQSIGENVYSWWARVSVSGQKTVTADLDNAAVDQYRSLCPEHTMTTPPQP
jgi:hypothetical protein